MIVRDIAVSRLKDYENNPRNNDLAVEKVKFSIERFGFLFPVIIDMNFVIVAGHTRVRACRELGIQSVPCIIADELTDEQINFFRLVDNKTSEYSDWDFEKLKGELAQIDLTLFENQTLLERFELNTQVFEIEPEQAEIKIPAFNFVNNDKPKQSKPSVSTVYVKGNSADDIEEDTAENLNDVSSHSAISAEDVAQRIAAGNGALQPSSEPKKINKAAAVQFRFGDVVFFISQVELDRLNAKYSEYIDSGEMLKRSFIEYLLEGVEKCD